MMGDPPSGATRDPHQPGTVQVTSWAGTQQPGPHAAPGTTPRPPRIVLVPGLGLDRRSWARVLGHLGAAGWSADVVVLPGMGVPAPVPSLDELAGELRARLGSGPVVLAGHSQGCQVAAAAATDARVRALVLFGPSTDPVLRSPVRLAGRWLVTAAGEPWWQVPLVLAQWLHTGPLRMRALWRRASPDRIDQRLATVGVPVTVVRGRRDRLCDGAWAATVAAAAPRGRVVELPRAAHMTVQTRPRAAATVLATVLSTVLHEAAGATGSTGVEGTTRAPGR